MDINSQNTSVTHSLKLNGILKTFNINREVCKKDLTELCSYLGIDEKDMDEATKSNIHETITALSQMQMGEKIPGLVINGNGSISDRKLPKLFYISSVISEMLLMENLSQKECSFVISKTIKDLGINSQDY